MNRTKCTIKVKIIIVKYVIATISDRSSSDAVLYKAIQEEMTDFPLRKGVVIMSTYYPYLTGLEIVNIQSDDRITIIHTLPDKTFQRMAKSPLDDFSHTLDFKLKVSRYTNNFGFSLDEPSEVRGYFTRLSLHEEQDRKKNGFVLYKPADKRTAEDYQGGFSDKMFNSIKSRLKDGFVHGWIGSHTRTFEGDKAIENGLKKAGLGIDRIAKWLVSTDAKIFGSFVEGSVPKIQVKLIKEHINRLFNMVLVYGAADHNGSMEDTIRIRKEFEEMKILKPEKPFNYFEFTRKEK